MKPHEWCDDVHQFGTIGKRILASPAVDISDLRQFIRLYQTVTQHMQTCSAKVVDRGQHLLARQLEMEEKNLAERRGEASKLLAEHPDLERELARLALAKKGSASE